MQNRLADAVDPNRLGPAEPTIRVAEHAMDSLRQRVGDARADAYIQRIENARNLGAFIRSTDPTRVALLVDRLSDAAGAADSEYVVAIAVGGTVETAYLRRLRGEDLQPRFFGVAEVISLGFGDPPKAVDRRAHLPGWGLILVPVGAVLFVLYLRNPWVPVALVILTLVFAFTLEPSRLSSQPRSGSSWAPEGTLLQHVLSLVCLLALVAFVALALWAVWDILQWSPAASAADVHPRAPLLRRGA